MDQSFASVAVDRRAAVWFNQRDRTTAKGVRRLVCSSPSLTTPILRFTDLQQLKMASKARTCYNRDGTEISNDAYQPCISDSTRESFCCGTNHQGAGETNVADDVCESNGLCQNYEAFNGSNEGVKLWWRQGCTDPTWQSEECLRDVCNDGQVS